MADSTRSGEPGERIVRLLFTDFDGDRADPDDVISDGLDGGYADRTEALTEVLGDRNEGPYERFLACLALTRWGDAAGYAAVAGAAAAPEAVDWRGASYDRLHAQDDTFGLLAEAVGESADMVDERGTRDERVRAAQALLAVADRVQFDRRVSALLRADLMAACLPALRDAVDRGVRRLAERERLGFDLGLQLALMIAAARAYDAPWAADAEARLTAAEPGERALRELR
ncbi:hypothetical protein C3486_16795 [Streptomyces sp. Ru73]|uniref:hypothetical protein n=1 Tax=Streptomyces sp. Ru73 TaxID=2080748 RepID=UPI000CDCE6DE|nr:hypothetical protein [Streptomyces sp. Ru73]POX39768.1 hypothetical protein C3486_16795 [Streptomyces sp. Ru73]